MKDVSQTVLLPVPGLEETPRRNISRPTYQTLLQSIQGRFARLERGARAQLRTEKLGGSSPRVERWMDVRYAGQAYEISVPFTPNFAARFHSEHERAYGYAQAGRQMEIVSLRVRLIVPSPKPPARPRATRRTNARSAMVKVKPVWFDGRFHNTPVYDRERLSAGARFAGPAVVVEYSSTTVVPPDFVCRVDEFLNLRLSQHAR